MKFDRAKKKHPCREYRGASVRVDCFLERRLGWVGVAVNR